MSLTREAIQLITDTALIAEGKELGTFTPTIVLPDGAKIVNLEQYSSGRSRFRGTFSTNSLVDFSKYVQDRAAPDAKGFINQDEMNCSVLFNLGTELVPGHADDSAVLKLKPTAAYQAVQAISGRAMSQKDMSDWIEDWHSALSAVGDNLQNIPLAKAIAAVRTISVKATSESDHTVSETRASRSAMDAIEATSKETLPTSLIFSAVPFEGLQLREIILRISVITSGSQPALKLRWVGEEVQREEIAQEFKSVLEVQIGEAASLALGSFSA
ncbi:YfdQ family protein [Pseudomonas capsici]|uniref:YfdQ family protein n=1 Tax=Pseudomonas capsici TaxID=2810614 RepID=UPI0021F1DEC1|nr:YfdQ family protein [Pseudomonas capsici]MCV4287746.1 YfdQ family protein [Pseudomonas capsici]